MKEKIAQKIQDHFFNLGAKISKQDWDFILEALDEYSKSIVDIISETAWNSGLSIEELDNKESWNKALKKYADWKIKERVEEWNKLAGIPLNKDKK